MPTVMLVRDDGERIERQGGCFACIGRYDGERTYIRERAAEHDIVKNYF